MPRFSVTDSDLPDLKLVRGVVAPEIVDAASLASQKLRETGIPHALTGGLAVGAHGYPRTTDHVVFLVGHEAFEKHEGGFVTLKLPLIAIGSRGVRPGSAPALAKGQGDRGARGVGAHHYT